MRHNYFSYRRKTRSKHNQALAEILRDPMLIYISDELTKIQIELPFYKTLDTSQLLGEADVVLHREIDGRVYIVEYKGTDTDKQREKAEEQLFRAREGILNTYGLETKSLLYVHDDFVTEELTKWGFIKLP